MTVAELREVLSQYPDDQFVHIRTWIGEEHHYDCTIDKAQQGVDGALLLTNSIEPHSGDLFEG